MPKPNYGIRITELEDKFDLILKKLNERRPPPAPIAAETLHDDLRSESRTSAYHDGGKTSRPTSRDRDKASPSPRQGRRRERRSVSQEPPETYTPRNQQGLQTSQGFPSRHRSCTPVGPRAQAPMYSTADVLNSPNNRLHAQQLLNLLNPQWSEQGKVFDTYLQKPARFPMPRLFVNSTAQKVIKQYKNIDDLTIPQFLEGFTHMVKKEPDYRVKEQMLDHLIDIAVTMQDFAWETTREWSNSVMISIGQGGFNWGNTQSIENEKHDFPLLSGMSHPWGCNLFEQLILTKLTQGLSSSYTWSSSTEHTSKHYCHLMTYYIYLWLGG